MIDLLEKENSGQLLDKVSKLGQVTIILGDGYMGESSKYGGLTFGDNKGNITIENNGTLNQGMASQSDDIILALKQLHEDIQSLSDDQRDIAEAHFELLQTHINNGDKEKAKKPLEKLSSLLGVISSIISIASALGLGFPLK
ncbi:MULTISPECIES: hypothetical protein [unclassified Lysinibacillus]|uniref:hypothetical protein n=1 Tax=unclassified Lysinibacillus TaxID=2636778 RepID=UPI002553BAA7|nr:MULTISPECIES: hypothetical protein [unclassified Lysinibacillus]MDM5248598.1 hypothetical protein [Lysinibacillus sp. G4S2]